MFNNIISAI